MRNIYSIGLPAVMQPLASLYVHVCACMKEPEPLYQDSANTPIGFQLDLFLHDHTPVSSHVVTEFAQAMCRRIQTLYSPSFLRRRLIAVFVQYYY